MPAGARRVDDDSAASGRARTDAAAAPPPAIVGFTPDWSPGRPRSRRRRHLTATAAADVHVGARADGGVRPRHRPHEREVDLRDPRAVAVAPQRPLVARRQVDGQEQVGRRVEQHRPRICGHGIERLDGAPVTISPPRSRSSAASASAIACDPPLGSPQPDPVRVHREQQSGTGGGERGHAARGMCRDPGEERWGDVAREARVPACAGALFE